MYITTFSESKYLRGAYTQLVDYSHNNMDPRQIIRYINYIDVWIFSEGLKKLWHGTFSLCTLGQILSICTYNCLSDNSSISQRISINLHQYNSPMFAIPVNKLSAKSNHLNVFKKSF